MKPRNGLPQRETGLPYGWWKDEHFWALLMMVGVGVLGGVLLVAWWFPSN